MQCKNLDVLEFSERVLETEVIGSDVRMELSLDGDYICGQGKYAMLKLRAYIWAEHIQNEIATVFVQTPASWWQHFKQDCFPKWALEMWPVVNKTVSKTYEFKTVALLPEFKYTVPSSDMGRFVIRTMKSEVA